MGLDGLSRNTASVGSDSACSHSSRPDDATVTVSTP